MGCGRHGDVLVDGRLVENVTAVVNELLTKLLRKFVCLTALSRAVVHVVLHEVEEKRVRSVHDSNAAADNLAINGLELAKDDVVVHCQRVLTSPVPRRIVHASFERGELGLNSRCVELAMLGRPEVQLRLERGLSLC